MILSIDFFYFPILSKVEIVSAMPNGVMEMQMIGDLYSLSLDIAHISW